MKKKYFILGTVTLCMALIIVLCGSIRATSKETETENTEEVITEAGVQRYLSMAYEPPQEEESKWTDEERYVLLKIAMAEAEGEDSYGKALVMLVVLNRVAEHQFPDDIKSVVMQKKQFSPVWNGRYDAVEPDADCEKALELIESGWDESHGALYFESSSASKWHRENLVFLFQHGNHYFYTEE